MKRTPLYESARVAGARFVDFGGWTMPVRFQGVIAEHSAVRTRAGLFDVSHMGEARVSGPNALQTIQRLITNDASTLEVGQSLYSPMCYEDGGIVDDCLVYRFSDAAFVIVINASNIDKDLAWIREQAATTGGEVTDLSDETALLALQGPEAEGILARCCGKDLADVPRNQLIDVDVGGVRCRAARTGYTGEDGFELFIDAEPAARAWDVLLDGGKEVGLIPCGLGARDTLRLEARLVLYGNDIDETTTPLEAGLRWTVKLDKGAFVGRDALVAQKAEGIKRRLVGFEVMGRAIARHGHEIFEVEDGATRVGTVTSGTKSPTLAKSIGLAYVPKALGKIGAEWWVDVRGKRVEARVVKTPFYKRSAT